MGITLNPKTMELIREETDGAVEITSLSLTTRDPTITKIPTGEEDPPVDGARVFGGAGEERCRHPRG